MGKSLTQGGCVGKAFVLLLVLVVNEKDTHLRVKIEM